MEKNAVSCLWLHCMNICLRKCNTSLNNGIRQTPFLSIIKWLPILPYVGIQIMNDQCIQKNYNKSTIWLNIKCNLKYRVRGNMNWIISSHQTEADPIHWGWSRAESSKPDQLFYDTSCPALDLGPWLPTCKFAVLGYNIWTEKFPLKI